MPKLNLPIAHLYTSFFSEVKLALLKRQPSSGAHNLLVTSYHFKVTRPSFLGEYHPILKLSGIPTFTFIVSLTHRMDNI